MVPSGSPNDRIVATFEHFALKAVDISNSMSSRGITLCSGLVQVFEVQ